MSATIPLPGLIRHEIRLAWRDLVAMLTAGRPARLRRALIGIAVIAAVMHLPAMAMVGKYAALATAPDKTALLVLMASIVMAAALMLSQAIESVTRAFYARADLDLMMSSPVRIADVFSIRLMAIALAVTMMALVVFAPFVDVLVVKGGPRWLAAFGVVVALGLLATAAAIVLTAALFHLFGPKRTRLVAQILAAVIGAAFIIGLQVAGIMSYGTLSRFAVLTSDAAAAAAPDPASLVWWPVRALLGDPAALLSMLAAGLLGLGATMALFSRGIGDAVARASSAATSSRHARPRRGFRPLSRHQALWWKELLLLRRDPWLVSQTLMQLLYLVPPALFLWRSFGDLSGAAVLITPVIVMAAGQLSGGLAWLTISGEDARDLVATAPLASSRVTRAKVEIVLMIIAVVFAPLVIPLALASPSQAVVAALGVALAGASATAIQLWFRVEARRSQFRRRQTASRFATFAEAFSSIGWAATAGLTAAMPGFAAISAALTVAVLAVAWKLSPAGRS
jgi:ABC-2 type transport system permease protein